MNIDTLKNQNFELLARLFGGSLDSLPEAAKSEVSGYMDLHFDRLQSDGDTLDIALSHYYKMNGDCVADPDMRLRLNRTARTAEALSYQDFYGYREVYRQKNGQLEADLRALTQQNTFLHQWLTNCINQGHKLEACL